MFERLNSFEEKLLKSLYSNKDCLNSHEQIISWFTNLKSFSDLSVNNINYSEVKDWIITDDKILNKSNKYFEVIGLSCEIGKREMKNWDQPIIKQIESGIIGFITKSFNGVIHFLVQAKIEAGNFDIYELAPTVQCITGSYLNPEYDVPYLEELLNEGNTKIFDNLLSEEGGRFYHEQNRNIVIYIEDDLVIKEEYIWMTLGQIKEFIKYNNYFNIEARSIISCLSPI